MNGDLVVFMKALYPVAAAFSTLQNMSKANVLAFDTSVLVEEKEYRGQNCIRLQQVGSKKEHWIRFDVSCECSYQVIACQGILREGPLESHYVITLLVLL